MIIAQLSIAPVGVGVHLSLYVKKVIEVLKEENVTYKINAMATVIETESLDQLFRVVQKAHNAVLSSGVQRVITELKIDHRVDSDAHMQSKIDAVS